MGHHKTRKASRKTNFYTTVNDKWQGETDIPNTETRVTQAYFIQEKINDQLGAIIAKDTSGPIHTLVQSWNAASISEDLTPLLQLMLSMTESADIAGRIGWMNHYGIASPISIYVQGDPRAHRRCRVFIEEGDPRIGIPEYWTEPEYVKHRRAYGRYVERLANILGLPQLAKGYGAERDFASFYPIATERRTRIDMLTWTELCKEYRNIDWTAMLTAWGLREDELPHLYYNVTSKAFLHHIQQCITGWPIERWAAWFALTIAQWFAGCSPHGPLRSAWFDYSRRYLQGSVADNTPKELRESIVRTLMPNTLGKLWIDRHCRPSLKREMTTMIERIRTGATSLLRKTSWMAPSTRAAAIKKLRRMDVQVCWPSDLITKEIPCGLSDTSFINNLLTIGALGTDENIGMLRSGDCRRPSGAGWTRPVFIVNAYYYPDENRFLLPAAILNPPFYDPDRSAPWNYGAIGATIGHEFCHAFDSEGRTYDEHGDVRDWWTPRDSREYKKKAHQVVRLYESRPYRGLDVDGNLTLVENIADIGGIEFALAGLRQALGREPTKAEHRDFFTSYGVSWRTKDRMRRAAELLATNSHSPPALRVNHVVRQFDAWYSAFDMGPDSPEWIPPAKRIHFFT